MCYVMISSMFCYSLFSIFRKIFWRSWSYSRLFSFSSSEILWYLSRVIFRFLFFPSSDFAFFDNIRLAFLYMWKKWHLIHFLCTLKFNFKIVKTFHLVLKITDSRISFFIGIFFIRKSESSQSESSEEDYISLVIYSGIFFFLNDIFTFF